jgi:hypothetical protein
MLQRWTTFGLRAASLLLFVFHVVLFTTAVARGRASDPLVALRWAAALVLFAALVALWRLRVPLLWGRRAVVFWLLVLLLHGTAHAPADTVAADGASGGAVLVILPALATGIGILGLSLLWAAHAGTGRGARPALRGSLLALAPVPRTRTCIHRVLAPRAPPFL